MYTEDLLKRTDLPKLGPSLTTLKSLLKTSMREKKGVDALLLLGVSIEGAPVARTLLKGTSNTSN